MFKDERITGSIPFGWSVDEIIGQMVVEHAIHPGVIPAIRVSVWTDATGVETVIPYDQWRFVRPKAGASVRIHVVPQGGGGGGGGGKSPVKLIAMLAVVVAVVVFQQYYLAPELMGTYFAEVGIGLTMTEAAIAGGIAAGALSLIGNAIVNALIPTSPAANRSDDSSSYSTSATTPTYNLMGVRNRANPFGPIPKIYGRRRVFPMLAANTYSESQGSDQYLRALFSFGYGPLEITDLKIGDTSIDDFMGVEYEVRQGYDSDTPLTLFTQSVSEQTLNVHLTNAGSWAVRTTRAGTTEISVDVNMPRGLTKFESGGGRSQRSVSLSVEYSPTGAGTWTSAGTISATDNTTSAIRGSLRWTVTAGQYDVRIRRDTVDSTDDTIVDGTYWSALRSITNEYPINQTGLALIAVRIKASEQLNGSLDTLNAVCTSLLPIWDGNTWSAPTATRNPAWMFCDVLRGRANPRPTEDQDIDLDTILDWATACDTTSPQGEGPMWLYDAVHDKSTTVDQMLRDVAAAGRARYIRRDGKESVVRDVAQTTAWQHFTPRNSWGFRSVKTFVQHPHGLRVRFVNPDKDWQEDELIVYSDGYNADGSGGLTEATLFEQVDMMHCTTYEQAYREGRYHMAAALLRPAVYEINTDVENLACQPGDLIYVAYDVPLWGNWQSRIRSLTYNGSGEATTITLDSTVTMDAAGSYVVRIRRTSDNGSLLVPVNTVAGQTDTLTFTTPIAVADLPAEDDLVLFGENGSESVRCIVKSINRGDNLSAKITFVDEAPAVHTSYTGTIPAFVSNITRPVVVERQRPSAPTVMDVWDDEILVRGSITSRTYVSVETPVASVVPVTAMEIQYRAQGATDWVVVSNVGLGQTINLDTLAVNQTYEFRARSVSQYGMVSDWLTTTHLNLGVAAPPEDVTGFSISVLDTTAYLSWVGVGDVDLSHYVIKWSESLVGATWSSAQVLLAHVDGTSVTVPALIGTYLIKAVDYSGSESVNEALVTNGVSGINNMNTVATVTEDPSWAGVKSGTVNNSGALELTYATNIDDVADIDAIIDFDTTDGGVASSGIYEFSSDLDLGTVVTSRLTASVTVNGLSLTNNVDLWAGVDAITSWDGTTASDWGIELQVATSDDYATWGAWQTFVIGDYSARAFKWRIVLYSYDVNITPSVTALSVTVDMPDRLDSDNNVACGTGGLTVTFSPAFKVTPAIAVADQDMQTGDYKTITSASASGFTIRYYNSGGTPVARTFDWVARGYGYVA